MNAVANPTKALRPFLPDDVPQLLEIFRASIEELTADDYSEEQREAWTSEGDDEDKFAKRLAGQLTLVGTVQGSPAGFISLQGTDVIDMFYVHPAAAGQGVGAMLYDALEKLTAARGAASLKVDASDTGREFFEKRGFVAQRRNTMTINGVWIANTTLEKKLTASRSA